MNFLLENNLINNSLVNWDFNSVEVINEELSTMDIRYVPNYCKYLADIGKLDKVNSLLNSRQNIQKLMQKEESFKVCIYLERLHSQLSSKDDFFSLLYRRSFGEYLALYNLLKNFWDKKINNSLTPEENMILNFAIVKLAENNLLDVELSIKIINHFFNAKNVNHQRRKYIFKLIIEYCARDNTIAPNFFKLREQFYNHLQKILSLLHRYSSDEYGAKTLINTLNSEIQKHNDLSLIRNVVDKPKVAVCISGICKASLTGLESIYNNIISPLKADVFMHTWDIQQDWAGDARVYNFWSRVFGVKNDELPSKLHDLNFIENEYPNIYKSLLSSHYSSLNIDTLKSNFIFNELAIENQDNFIRVNNIDENYQTRNTYNQIKMFYGIYKSFELMKNFEKTQNIKYDYVIRIRPDLLITEEFSLEKLAPLNIGELAVSTGDVGVADSLFYAHRETFEQVVNIWLEMLRVKKLSPFAKFPKYDCHALLWSWLLYKNIIPTRNDIKSNLTLGTKDLKVPNLKESLISDCNIKTRFKYPTETEWLETFLTDKAK
ncbi:hypothetical protein [Actinobacillus genomosp. 1]|uniref:hypothetical protein n=1 Tax=Actinobacillus genomosp. 1 TaxID=254839 RepID=UPI0024432074|nr:hypothetical protein [Actinobacillus genomosp. 1]WGE90850.1 hypothetical protein NYR63_08490 [Actinobacillus genomosp. 1]